MPDFDTGPHTLVASATPSPAATAATVTQALTLAILLCAFLFTLPFPFARRYRDLRHRKLLGFFIAAGWRDLVAVVLVPATTTATATSTNSFLISIALRLFRIFDLAHLVEILIRLILVDMERLRQGRRHRHSGFTGLDGAQPFKTEGGRDRASSSRATRTWMP